MAYSSLSDVNAIALRLVFRHLMHAGVVQVTPDFNKPEMGLSASQFVSRARAGDLASMIESQGAVQAALAKANGVAGQEAAPTEASKPVETEKEADDEFFAATAPVKSEVEATPSAVAAAAGADTYLSGLAVALTPYLKVGMDKAEITNIVRETVKNAIDGSDAKVLEIRTPAQTVKLDELRHKNFEKLLVLSGARIHSMLIGPAGTGKSHAAEQVAKALDVQYRAESVGPQTTQAALLGYKDAHGNTVRTHFRECYEHGGVFCLDEVDAGSAAVLTVLNSALANGRCAFPDTMVTQNANFILIATANTWGNGRSLEYNGRNALDAAFLNRFARMPWPEDEKLEREMSPVSVWTKYVQAVRKLFRDKSIKAVISPRTSKLGGIALQAGMSVADVIECFVRCGLSEEANKVLDTVYVPTVEGKK